MSVDVLRPRLVSYARYRWDTIRTQHQIVYPEGVLVLNDSSAAILELCDGRTVDEVIETLSSQYEGADVGPDVHEFLRELIDKGLVRDDDDA